MRGRTDPDILAETLAAHGLPPAPGGFAAFTAALVAAYEGGADLLRRHGRAQPGAAAAIAALAGADGVVQSVLTGNVREVAALKLAAFGLDAGLNLEAGAYGSDDGCRASLVAVARARAVARHGPAFGRAATVLVGDTPHDVRAALDGGAEVVAVATGGHTEVELRRAGAAVVLPDLRDTALVVRLLAGTG
jgi:phosphoglycolate phosphatase-like HAD superfamily hydrolase